MCYCSLRRQVCHMKFTHTSRALQGMAVATAMFCLIPAVTQAQTSTTSSTATKSAITTPTAEASKMPPAPAADKKAQVIEIQEGKGDVMPPLGTKTGTKTDTKTLTKTTAETGNSAETAHEYEVAPGEETHPPVRLTPDRTEMIALDNDASNIIIGNPAHVNILLSNSRTLLLAPRQPGATQFTVLDAKGKVVMRRHVIVSGPKENYVRIRRTCTGGVAGCQPTTVYYCPDICHDVRMLAGQGDNSQANDAVPAAPAEGPSGTRADIDGTNIDQDDDQIAPVEEEAGGEDSSDASSNE